MDMIENCIRLFLKMLLFVGWDEVAPVEKLMF
jgi:hypothetical protein